MNKDMIIRASRLVWTDSVEVHIGFRYQDGSIDLCKPPVVERIEPGDSTTPCLSLPYQTAQRLMDELWGCGLRPSEGTGSAGSLAATERHLQDMRALVVKTTNADLPGVKKP